MAAVILIFLVGALAQILSYAMCICLLNLHANISEQAVFQAHMLKCAD